jgi:4,5-dihydroxyphthalate decarboxylase
VTQEFEDTRELMGKDFWRYGIEANRKELELVMRYTHEQGLLKRRLKVEEVFHPSTLELAERTRPARDSTGAPHVRVEE